MTDRRTAFLQEMGVGPLWLRRDAAPSVIEDATETVASSPEIALVPASVPATVPDTMESAWDAVPAAPVRPDMPIAKEAAVVRAAATNDVAGMGWTQLKAAVAECMKCGLCHGRTKTVFGVGDEKAKWLFIGEGPGRNEDMRGEPFVGQAGKLLDNMLLAMGLKRGENAYIANIVKCRPTDDAGKDRPPTPEETAACMPYLERQIALIQPTILVALGKTAALTLLALDPDTPVSKLRGTVHRYAGLPLVVTYHPAYLLRNMADKKKAWEDLCLAMQTYAKA
ncbi:MAG TPA: uracil-DNA glycosylase [Noviherbaspirillum sp.]